jgi:hypothetical protein
MTSLLRSLNLAVSSGVARSFSITGSIQSRPAFTSGLIREEFDVRDFGRRASPAITTAAASAGDVRQDRNRGATGAARHIDGKTTEWHSEALRCYRAACSQPMR